nr:hypothetical protein GCM10017745_55270 [Saccharothrix mutabilis subsp. capreolus]
MAKDPADRHPSAGALATAAAAALTAALGPATSARPSTTPAPSTPSRPEPAPSRPAQGGLGAGRPAALGRSAPPGRSSPPSRPSPFSPSPTSARPPAPASIVPPGTDNSGARSGLVGPVVAGVVALALVAVVLGWAVDWGKGERVAGSNTGTAATTAATTAAAGTAAATTTAATSSASAATTTAPTIDAQTSKLLASLPETFRGNPSCAPAPPTGQGIAATVTCSGANSRHFRFPPPDSATFHLFTDRAAQDAHFLALVGAHGIGREDESGGCRPETRPAHYALYYRDTSGPLPGEFTTCFVADGVGQVWWVDTRTTTTGVLRSSTATTPDALDGLGYWWNGMVLTAMS